MDINIIDVEMLARKIVKKEVNPITGEEFKLEDIKIEEYKPFVEEKMKEMEEDINGASEANQFRNRQ